MAKPGDTIDPTPGAVASVPVPRLKAAEVALRELINDEDLEEVQFDGGRVYWPEDEDLDAIMVEVFWDRELNEPPE